MSKIVISDLETAIEAIIKYFGQDVIGVKRIEKSALLETKKRGFFYFKFDRKPWFNAGYEIGRFKGAGMAVNADIFKTIDERYEAGILYCTLPNVVYYYTLSNFKKNSHKHTQKFNGESVHVISLYEANDVFYI